MKAFNRRDFLKAMGVSSLALFGGNTFFDSKALAAVRTNQLLLPGNSGVLGLFSPSGPFVIEAGLSSLEILQGKETGLWVYKAEQNGASFINPVIKIKKGDLFNATLNNALSEPTIIHWHGLNVDAKNDGHPADAIPGGSSYPYEFTVANRAGTYWYHTHAHGLTGKQAYYGLAGFYVVEDDEELALQDALDLEFGKNDIPLLLQDKRFDSNGNLIYSSGGMGMMGGMDGFLGNTVLANLTHNAFMDVDTRIYRFRILNGSNSRIYRLAFRRGFAQVPFSIIGTDSGLLDAPRQANEVFLAPGERVDVLLDLTRTAVGSVVNLTSRAFRGMDMMGRRGMMGLFGGMGMFGGGCANGSALQVLRLQVTKKISYDKTVPSELSTLDPPDENTNTTRDFTLSFAYMRWLINGDSYSESSVPVTVNEGSHEIWRFLNPLLIPTVT